MKRISKTQPLHFHLVRLSRTPGESLERVNRSRSNYATIGIMRSDRELRERADEGNRDFAGP